ncbi:MAG: methyl viologen-reducing hydrogenase [Candidatus Sabulitectum sp.]|nr:methyl viologen-reducing hydrogenase [Candidatus Sabulitectum sp.]
MKAKVSTEWLSGCSGCHIAVVDLHEKLLNLVDTIEFVRIPVLMDVRDYPKADIGLVEGAIRSDHDREAVLKMRESVDKLVAFGTCASYGGVSGLGWLYKDDAILSKVYGGLPTTTETERPQGAPVLEHSVIPIDEVVEVDVHLPGCPPHPYYIAQAIKVLLGEEGAVMPAGTVCSQCSRKMVKREGVVFKKGAVTAPEKDICFLSQGVICLGSVTLERCRAQCTNKGVTCAGCTGPSVAVVTEPHLDIRNMVAKRMSLLTDIDEKEILDYMAKEAKTFYSYALSSPIVYKKPTVEIREWVGEK